MYYITPDYAFGHTLEAGMIKARAALGGTRVGGDLTPLGTVDFSSYLIKAQAANPDVIIFLTQGDDMINALKQAVQFGLDKQGPSRRRAAGDGAARRPAARGAHRHLGDGMVLEAARRAACRRIRRGDQEADRPRADRAHLVRLCLGLDLRARPRPRPSRSKAVAMAKALQDFELPPEIALVAEQGLLPRRPEPAARHASSSATPRRAATAPDDLFKVTKVVNGADIAGSVEESGCKMTWPA